MEPDKMELAARALDIAPVDKRRRRIRRRVVIVDTVLIAAALVVSLAFALISDSDAAAPAGVAAVVGLQVLLAAVLSSEYVLTDWLTPEAERDGRAYYLMPHYSLGASGGRAAWSAWWAVNLLLWLAGGLLLNGVPGALAGLGIGVVFIGCCLCLGLLAGWMVALPLGLVVGVLVQRRRTVQSARLLLIALLLISILVLAVPAAWTDLGTYGAPDYLRAVLGLPDHVEVAPGVLWTARTGLALIALSVPPLVALLWSMPEQRIAGGLMRSEFNPPD